jgi:hypothetical protein
MKNEYKITRSYFKKMFRESDEDEKEDVSLKTNMKEERIKKRKREKEKKRKREKIKRSLMFEMILNKISTIIFCIINDIL